MLSSACIDPARRACYTSTRRARLAESLTEVQVPGERNTNRGGGSTGQEKNGEGKSVGEEEERKVEKRAYRYIDKVGDRKA